MVCAVWADESNRRDATRRRLHSTRRLTRLVVIKNGEGEAAQVRRNFGTAARDKADEVDLHVARDFPGGLLP